MASVEVPDGTNLVGRGLLVCLVLPTNVVDAAVAADHDLVARAHCRRLARISISDHDWLRDIAPAGTSRVREPFPVGNDRPLPRFGIWRSGHGHLLAVTILIGSDRSTMICLPLGSLPRTPSNSGTRTRPPSILAGMLFDGDGNPMTPTHATKKGRRYRYYVSRPLIANDQTDGSAGLRIPAGEIEQAVTNCIRRWLIDAGSVHQAVRRADPSAQRRLVARAEEIGKSWSELPAARQRTFLAALIERIEVGTYQIDIQFRPTPGSAPCCISQRLHCRARQTKPKSCPCRFGCAAADTKSSC